MTTPFETVREALEAAQNVLKWYRDAHPGDASQADDEMDAEIEEALTALSELEQMAGELEQSLDFYKRRCDALQQWQSKMRDPERTIVCDILANGCTLEPAGDRYAAPPAQQPQKLEDSEQYRMQMAGICTAATGYWKEGDPIHPDYDTPALRDVAKLCAKYDELYKAQQPQVEAVGCSYCSHPLYAGIKCPNCGGACKQPQAEKPIATLEPASSYVQPVPDHCDRIVWRNHYYHLPLKQPQAEAVPAVTDAMALAFHRALTDGAIGQSEVEDIKTGLRAALAAQGEKT